MSFSSDPLLELIHRLREQSGIVPIPLSEAEKSSGAMEALSVILSPSRGGGAPTASASKDLLDNMRHFRQQTGITPEPLLEAENIETFQEPMVVVERSIAQKVDRPKEYAIPEKPRPQPLPAEPKPTPRPSKRTSGFLAAYKKNQ